MKSGAIILVDIGNTSTHIALELAGCFLVTKRLSSRGQTGEMVRRLLRHCTGRCGVEGAILCSVVPGLDKIWMDELKRNVGRRILQVNYKLNLGVKIDCPKPATIGADRLANVAAAAEKYGGPVIVADFGTGLTFDIVSSAGAFIGGIIAPGPMLFAEYLAERTALLPRLSLPIIRKAMTAKGRRAVIGKNTKQAMLIGLRLGYLGLVKEIVSRLKQEKGLKKARLCATGGYAGFILSGSGLKIDIDPVLTLRGISRIYRLNR